ncbi:SagB/ThcOx family dehydrogenase [Phorcysia thermohydrogeniphila]|uniref:SagB-type dehydrogenase family enzyme n=1 Tax=Phorcysia thermohydrogeniphila TaxID=936138 RepID=A0A4R1GEN2_9BACT|nr:SagB/ThcOx family dehydrogenase [Phorcysia thermohydrogeniphila]TCK05270.1 SagB-type dehydrogenase family enzyme [Phorcysia thermohydrogeniphila]
MNCYNYHIKTAHTFESVRRPHYLDWSNYPSPFKVYKGIKKFSLLPFKGPLQETLDVLYRLCGSGAEDVLSFGELSDLAFAMNGISRVENFHGEEFYFRTVPSAGALYPFELYFFVKEVEGIPDGLYHYQPIDHSLELLVEKDFFELLQTALCAEIPGNVVAVITSIYARSAWKYRTRAYRYCLLDAGHMASNGVVFLRSVGLGGCVVSKFKDDKLNQLLGVDGENEFALAAVLIDRPALFWGDDFIVTYPYPPFEPVVRKPIYNAEIVNTHLVGNLDSCEFYREYPDSDGVYPEVNSLPLKDALLRRRSKRKFTGERLDFERFKYLLESSLNCFPADWGFPQTSFYLQVKNVEGVADGIYAVGDGELYPVMKGDFSREVAYLCLAQGFIARANVNVIFTFDFSGKGCRDYRGALMEAGALGELLYLAAESLGLGVCGIGAFYDFDLKRFLSLPEFEYPVYVVSVGIVK